jgi:hypothetical protein
MRASHANEWGVSHWVCLFKCISNATHATAPIAAVLEAHGLNATFVVCVLEVSDALKKRIFRQWVQIDRINTITIQPSSVAYVLHVLYRIYAHG